ncbi:MAG: arsenical pump-driving ATPase GET3 [Nanoarchaeota archaeon]|nr:arsenical pump-driving ATPase GET3 [Nanoarchaeota archaeon]
MDMNLLKRKTQYYLFSGKGGVGKTTVAAATAVWFAKQKKKTLIISIDPAHSLSDSFEKKIGSGIAKLASNLWACEIDPATSLSEYKEKLMPQIDNIEVLKSMGLGDLFDLAGNTPGIDELAAFDKFLQYMTSDEYDIVIFDTAPTGHTLRFLSLPDVLDSWIGKMIKMRMMFSGVTGMIAKLLPFGNKDEKKIEKVGTKQLDEMKEKIARAREILSDPKRSHFNLVLIPEEMSILESERSMKILAEYHIPVATVIINQLIPENKKCTFCAAKRNQQQQRVSLTKKAFPKKPIKQLPLFKEETKGMKSLETVAKLLYM